MHHSKLRYLLGVVVLALLASSIGQVQAAPPTEEPQRVLAPTYRIFATRQGLVGRTTANGHVIRPRDRFVALPSWTALSPRGSDKFSVRITYNGRSVIAPVWDVGPWNTRDDYWNPNRRYSDLPVGLPMAAAARLNGYNGGRDERGRRILLPNGLDIGDGTFWDDLQMTKDDWVEVTFLWLGADPGPGGAVAVTPQFTNAPAAPAVEAEAGALVVDAGGAGYTPVGEPWTSVGCGFGDSHQSTQSTNDPARATAAANWSPTLPAKGFYEVLAYLPNCGGTATSSARYRVHHDGVITEVVVDQQARSGTWASLGTYHFDPANPARPLVELSDLTNDTSRAVRFDAIVWARRSDTTPPTASILAIQPRDNGYQITWGGTDDISGIAAYDIQVRILPNGGWTDWKRETAEMTAWFGPHEGKHFAFRVRAKDWASNLQPWPEQAQLDTTQATP
ncbi:MAG: hypothetical protein AB4911_25270 [Oscillochloridaceae bacterium umkhey_bin13]